MISLITGMQLDENAACSTLDYEQPGKLTNRKFLAEEHSDTSASLNKSGTICAFDLNKQARDAMVSGAQG